MATDRVNRGLPAGLRLHRHRTRYWPWAIVLMLLGMAAGGVAADTSVPVMLGILAVVVAIGATLYSPALGLSVLAFTYPFDLVTYAGPIKLTTSALLMAILLIVLLGRTLWGSRWHWSSTELDLPVLVFAGATLLSLLGLAGYWEDQIVGLLKALGGFVMFFLATQALRARVDVWLVIGAVLAAASAQAAVIAFQVLTGSVIVSEETRAIGTVDDPNLFAGYLVLVAPLALTVGVSFRKWWTVAVTVGILIAFSVALIATLSRSGWIGALVGLVMVAVVLPERRRLVAGLTGGIAVTAVLILLAPIAARIAPHATGPEEMLAARIEIWMVALAVGLHHPIFGVGVANFVNYYPQYGGVVQGINHAHDIFLNMFVERGILGFLAFTAVVLFVFKSLWQSLLTNKSTLDRALVAGLIGSFAGYLVHALVEVSYYDYKVLLLFWLMVGMAAAIPKAGRGNSTHARNAPLPLSA